MLEYDIGNAFRMGVRKKTPQNTSLSYHRIIEINDFNNFPYSPL